MAATHFWYPEDGNLLQDPAYRSAAARMNKRRKETNLLLKVPPVLLVDEDEVEVISRAELLVHVSECGRKIEATEE